jgi:Phage integrase family
VRRRFAPRQFRHAHAVEMAREGVPLIVIQRQLGHTNLGITSIYLQGIDNTEIIDTVEARRAPMVPYTARLPTDAGTATGGAERSLPAAGARRGRRPTNRLAQRLAERPVHREAATHAA